MNKEQYIEKLIAIYKLKYRPSDLEIEEFKLMLEMMPNDNQTLIPREPIPDRGQITTPPGIPFPGHDIVMYGCPTPYQILGVDNQPLTGESSSELAPTERPQRREIKPKRRHEGENSTGNKN